MADLYSSASTHNTKFIRAPQAQVYSAFTDPDALAIWFAPEDNETGTRLTLEKLARYLEK